MDLINILFAKALNKEDATKEYVNEAIKALKGEVNADLDTLEELSKALGNDPDFFLTIKNEIDGFKTELVTNKDAATENTRFAIGVAEQSLEVPSMEEFNQLKDEKLSEPADGLAVGKYFRVAALDANSHAVLEAVDAAQIGVQDVKVAGASVVADGVANVPLAENAPAGTQAKYGLVALGDKLNYGLTLAHDNNHNADVLALSTPDQITIDNRNKTNWLSVKYAPLMAANLDYAVKVAMCDGKGAAWTSAEQKAARDRMGIPGDYELIEEITLAKESMVTRSTEPDGTPYNFSVIMLRAEFPPTDKTVNIFISYYVGNKYNNIKSYFLHPYKADAVKYGYSKVWMENGRYRSGWWSCVENQGQFAQYCENPMQQDNYSTVDGNIISFSTDVMVAGTKITIYGVRA